MSASEKVCNFVPFDLSHWKKNLPQSKKVMNWPYLRPSMLRLTFELYAKKKRHFSFLSHPSLPVLSLILTLSSSPSVLWTDSVSEFAAFATGNDINYHRNVAKMWRCFFGIYIFQFVWSLCFLFFSHCINCQLDAQGFSRLLATVKHSDAALYMLWDGRGVL